MTDREERRIPIMHEWSSAAAIAADKLARSKHLVLVRLLESRDYEIVDRHNDTSTSRHLGSLESCLDFLHKEPAPRDTMTGVGSFTATARDLRVLVPPIWPVKIRRIKLPEGLHGDCGLVAKKGKTPYYAIRIDRSLDEQAQVFVLLHEWAHALSWGSESHRIDPHGPEWGLAMSRIWQAVIEL